MRPEDSATDWHLSESQLEEAARSAGSAPSSPPTPPAAPPAEKPAPPADALIGSSLRGYRVESKLGQGGMGAVYLAVHEQLQRQVAIKVLPPAMSDDAGLISRFQREARALAKLDSPHIVPVHDMFEQDGRFFIAMGLAAGGSVKDLLKKGPIDEGRARRILLEAARGLDSAHSQGIVHRDIKPDNLLLDEQGRVKIADFGLAKGGLGAQGLTVVGTVMGTPAYMSPEQWDDSSSADIRSDLYSLGCTFFKMLTGRALFKRSGMSAYMKAHCSEPIPDVRTLRPEISAASALLLEKLLEKDAADRFQTPAALLEALEAVADTTTMVESSPVPAEVSVADPTVWPSLEGSSKPGSNLESSQLSGVDPTAVAPATSPEPPTSAPQAQTARVPAGVAEAAAPSEPTLHGEAAPLAPRRGRPWALLSIVVLIACAAAWWFWGRAGPGPAGPGGGPPVEGIEVWWDATEGQRAAAAELALPLAVSEQGADFVLIPAGSFTMGSPVNAVPRLSDELPHQVQLSGAVWMMAQEVSRGLWEQVMGSPLAAQGQRGPRHPAVKLDWFAAVRFCNQLSAAQGLQPAYQVDGDQVSLLAAADGYRLPTEAEWEYACRAETETPYWSGKRLSPKEANFSAVDDFLFSEGSMMRLTEVGSLLPNPWGLYDMHGNAYEWCGDYYGAYPDEPARDPRGPNMGTGRIIRGGSGYQDASYCRSARRAHLKPETLGESVGFRVVRPVR